MSILATLCIPGRCPRFRFLLALLLLPLLAGPLRSQGLLTLVDVDESAFPVMSGKLYATDADGNLIHDLNPGDIILRENGIPRQVLGLSCPPPSPPLDLSSVLMIDVSGSMASGGPNIEIARSAARAWINALPLGRSECAVASFDDKSYLNQDLTTDRVRLLDAVAGLKPQGGTSYDAGLIAVPSGAIPIASRGRNKRIVVFLTDGIGDGNEAQIVAQALAANTTIYCITIGMLAPPILKNVAAQTGGLCFEQVTTTEQAARIYKAILAIAQGGQPCTITWRSDYLCGPVRRVDVEIARHGLRDTFILQNTRPAAASLEYNPLNADFGGVAPGGYRDLPITITMRGGAATVGAITTADPRFTIISQTPPPGALLQPGESVTVVVRYTPTSSEFVLTRLEVSSTACSEAVPILSSGVVSSSGPLQVLYPDGGEEFPAGSETVLRWTGPPADEPVRLEYSIDGGMSWNLIEGGATGLQYRWIVPSTLSRRCLLRVSQDGGSDEPVVLKGHSGPINAISFSPDGLTVATASNDGTVILWDAFTGQVVRTIRPGLEPGGRTGAVRTVQFSRDGRTILTAGYDGIIRVYDVSTGTATRQIGPPAGVPPSAFVVAMFSPDGSRIAAGYLDGTLCVFDAATAGEVFSVKAHTSPVVGLGFSPDGAYVSTAGGTDGAVAVWDAAGILIRRFPPPSADYSRRGIWTPDGTGFIIISNNLTLYKWPSGDLDRVLATRIYDASLNPDGTMLVIGNWPGSGARMDLYNIATGQVDRSFQHDVNGGVYVARFNPNGQRVASAGIGNDVKIWDLQSRPAQQDVSDSLWAIIGPVAVGDDLDMGPALIGTGKDSVVAGYLCNTGNGPLEVLSITFEGGAGAEFSVVSGDAPFVLGSGECRAVEFRFAPSVPGSRSATVVLATSADTLRYGIRGEGVQAALEILTNVIDFGGVRLGDKKDRAEVVIRNTGSVSVTIKGVGMPGPDTEQFFILAGGGSFMLAPGEQRPMEFRFMPIRTGRAQTRIVFQFDGPGVPLETMLFGEGLCTSEGAAHAVSLGSSIAEAEPGDTVTLPLLLLNATNMPPVGGAFTMGVRFNRRLLLPVGNALERTVVDGDTLFSYRGLWNGTADTLAVFRFLVALGDAESTDVMIESFRWEWACPVDIAREESNMRVRVCREGAGPRLFLDRRELALKPVRPNPSRGSVQVDLSLGTDGPLRLHLVDALGRPAGTLFEGNLTAGEHTLALDLNGIPAGRYVYVAESGTTRLSGVLEIVK